MGDTINLFETGNQNGNTGYTVLTLPTGMLHPTTVDTDDERFLGCVVATISEGVSKRKFIENSSGAPYAPSLPTGMDPDDLGHSDRLWEIRANRLDTAAGPAGLRGMLLNPSHTTVNGQGQTIGATTRLLPASTNGVPEDLESLDLDHVLDSTEVDRIVGILHKTWSGTDGQTWFYGNDIPIDNLHVYDLLKLLADYPYVCEGGRATDHGYSYKRPGDVPFNGVSIEIRRDNGQTSHGENWYTGSTYWPRSPGGGDIGVTTESTSMETVLNAVPRAALLQSAIINDARLTDDDGFVLRNKPSPSVDITVHGSKYVAGVELTNGDNGVSYSVVAGTTIVKSSVNDQPPTWARINPAGSRTSYNGLSTMGDPLALYVLLRKETTVTTQEGSEAVVIIRHISGNTVMGQVQIVLRDSKGNMYDASGPNQPRFEDHDGAYNTGAYAMNINPQTTFTTGDVAGTITLSTGQSYIDWLASYIGASINSFQVDFTPPSYSVQTDIEFIWVKLDWKPEYKNWGQTLMEDISNAISSSVPTPGDYESAHATCGVVQIAAVYGPIRPTS